MQLQKYVEEFMSSEFEGVSIPTSAEERIQMAVDKAYQNTMPPAIKGNTEAVKKAIYDYLQQWFEEYLEKKYPRTKEAFEGKYGALCSNFPQFVEVKLKRNYFKEFGNVQKIINLTFKYLYCLLPEKRDWFTFCHMPLDSYALGWYYEQAQIEPQDDIWHENTGEGYYKIAGQIDTLIENEEYKGLSPLEVGFIIGPIEKRKAIVNKLKSALNGFAEEPVLAGQLSAEQRASMDAFMQCLEAFRCD